MTAELAPEFLTNVSFARDVYTVDVDGDTWDDVVIINTFNQQPMLYMNLGLGEDGTWLGLADESAERFPELQRPAMCAVWVNDGQRRFVLRELPGQQRGRHGQGLPAHQRRHAELLPPCRPNPRHGRHLDIVKNTTLYNVAPWNSRGVLVLFNDGEGHFSNWQNLVPNASPYMFEVADFNGDGLLDLYVVDDGSDKLLTATEHVADTQLGFTRLGCTPPIWTWTAPWMWWFPTWTSTSHVQQRMAIYEPVDGCCPTFGMYRFDWVSHVALLDINNDARTPKNSWRHCAPTTTIWTVPDACDVCPNNPDPDWDT